MRTPMTRPRNFSSAARSRMIESVTMPRLCAMPASTRQCARRERARHLREHEQQRVPEQRRDDHQRAAGAHSIPAWLSTIEPSSAPLAKAGDQVAEPGLVERRRRPSPRRAAGRWSAETPPGWRRNASHIAASRTGVFQTYAIPSFSSCQGEEAGVVRRHRHRDVPQRRARRRASAASRAHRTA